VRDQRAAHLKSKQHRAGTFRRSDASYTPMFLRPFRCGAVRCIALSYIHFSSLGSRARSDLFWGSLANPTEPICIPINLPVVEAWAAKPLGTGAVAALKMSRKPLAARVRLFERLQSSLYQSCLMLAPYLRIGLSAAMAVRGGETDLPQNLHILDGNITGWHVPVPDTILVPCIGAPPRRPGTYMVPIPQYYSTYRM
jgi:hypothetical protein